MRRDESVARQQKFATEGEALTYEMAATAARARSPTTAASSGGSSSCAPRSRNAMLPWPICRRMRSSGCRRASLAWKRV